MALCFFLISRNMQAPLMGLGSTVANDRPMKSVGFRLKHQADLKLKHRNLD